MIRTCTVLSVSVAQAGCAPLACPRCHCLAAPPTPCVRQPRHTGPVTPASTHIGSSTQRRTSACSAVNNCTLTHVLTQCSNTYACANHPTHLSPSANEHHNWHSCSRSTSGISRYVPWSNKTTSNGCFVPRKIQDQKLRLPRDLTMMLPACGSPCMKPYRRVSSPNRRTICMPTEWGLICWAAMASLSVICGDKTRTHTHIHIEIEKSAMHGQCTRY